MCVCLKSYVRRFVKLSQRSGKQALIGPIWAHSEFDTCMCPVWVTDMVPNIPDIPFSFQTVSRKLS